MTTGKHISKRLWVGLELSLKGTLLKSFLKALFARGLTATSFLIPRFFSLLFSFSNLTGLPAL